MEYELAIDECWRRIRALRNGPPELAIHGKRRIVFAAAMKQAEQLFRSAANSGYEVKPILLYYGLSQSLRSVAAALKQGQDWQLKGHGLTCPNLDQGANLGDLTVVNQGANGALQVIARELSSATYPEAVELRDIWMSIPEGGDAPLAKSEQRWGAVKLSRLDGRKYWDAFDGTADQPGPAMSIRRLPWYISKMDANEIMREVTRHYPALRQFMPARGDDGRLGISFGGGPERIGLLVFVDPMLASDRLNRGMGAFDGGYCYEPHTASTWLTPALGGNATGSHPLIGWYAVLFALSMLARYRPADWTRMLDIDASPDAPAVEYLLDEAHGACVNLICTIFDPYDRSVFARTSRQRASAADHIDRLMVGGSSDD